MSTYSSLLRGGRGGVAIVAGRPIQSSILNQVSGDEPAMPTKGEPLEEAQVAVLRRWIAEGAHAGAPPAKPAAAPGPPRISSAPTATSAIAYSPDGTRLATTGDHEMPAQTERIAGYHRDVISNAMRRARARIGEIEAERGTQVEIAALQKQLETRTPALEIAQSAWEAAKQAGGVKWRPVALSLMRPEPGVRFEKEPNDVARVRGAVAGKDTSTVEGLVSGMITGFRLEGLPDKPLPGGGPGLAENGSFVLTPVRLLTGPSDDPAKLAEVELQHPRATHTQAGHPITNTIDQNPESAWSVRGRSGAVAASWQLNVRVARQPSFDGPVTVSVEGFTSRLGKGGEPLGIGADVTANAKVVAAAQELVFLDLTPKPGAAIGTRPIVTRAEATVNGEKVIVYDEAIPFTVAK